MADPSTRLADVVDPDELDRAIKDGHVRVQTHPSLPLRILNYTDRCTYERAWNPTTQACRGLIIDPDGPDGVVVGRPFPKFFNYGEHPAGSLDLAAPAEVTDKLDGSLGIIYPTGDWTYPWAVATRGSFASEQALHATEVLQTRYPDFTPPEGMTVLVEIIYPANRVVVDYGAYDDLVLLGAVDIATGVTVGPDWVSGWDGPAAEVMEARTLADALALPPRPNAEGVVVRMTGTDTRVKIKQDDYVALHRLITGMNARVVWERLGAGETKEDIRAGLPEEFWPWVLDVATDLGAAATQIITGAVGEFEQITRALPPGWTRKDFAAEAVASPDRAWLFMLLDGRDLWPAVWRTLRPSGERTLVAHSEDVA